MVSGALGRKSPETSEVHQTKPSLSPPSPSLFPPERRKVIVATDALFAAGQDPGGVNEGDILSERLLVFLGVFCCVLFSCVC